MRKFALILLITIISLSFTTDKPAYILYNQKGKKIKYEKMIKELSEADIVFFGEMHDDPISHWMQYEITTALYEIVQENLIIGAEMFEADNQLLIDEYFNDLYGDNKFEAEAKLWGNYKTDYKPVVKFAMENNIKYIATNIPRRYASMIYKKGFEALDELSEEAKTYISPELVKLYDPNVDCYKEMLSMMAPENHINAKTITLKPDSTEDVKTHALNDSIISFHKTHSTKKDTSESSILEIQKVKKESDSNGLHSLEYFPKSQASKDATMAHFILKNWKSGKLFLHFNGAYHSDNFEGIVWWINKLNPGLKLKTISINYQENIKDLDKKNFDKANYIIAVPKTMTRTSTRK